MDKQESAYRRKSHSSSKTGFCHARDWLRQVPLRAKEVARGEREVNIGRFTYKRLSEEERAAARQERNRYRAVQRQIKETKRKNRDALRLLRRQIRQYEQFKADEAHCRYKLSWNPDNIALAQAYSAAVKLTDTMATILVENHCKQTKEGWKINYDFYDAMGKREEKIMKAMKFATATAFLPLAAELVKTVVEAAKNPRFGTSLLDISDSEAVATVSSYVLGMAMTLATMKTREYLDNKKDAALGTLRDAIKRVGEIAERQAIPAVEPITFTPKEIRNKVVGGALSLAFAAGNAFCGIFLSPQPVENPLLAILLSPFVMVLGGILLAVGGAHDLFKAAQMRSRNKYASQNGKEVQAVME